MQDAPAMYKQPVAGDDVIIRHHGMLEFSAQHLNDGHSMDDDYAFALQILDQLNGVEEFDSVYYQQRSDRIRELADRHEVDSRKVFAVLVDALRMDIKEHPNQERLQHLLTKDT